MITTGEGQKSGALCNFFLLRNYLILIYLGVLPTITFPAELKVSEIRDRQRDPLNR